jgi:hypothetical protein
MATTSTLNDNVSHWIHVVELSLRAEDPKGFLQGTSKDERWIRGQERDRVMVVEDMTNYEPQVKYL